VAIGSDIQPISQEAASLGAAELAGGVPASDEPLSAFCGLDEDDLDLLA